MEDNSIWKTIKNKKKRKKSLHISKYSTLKLPLAKSD